MPRNRVLGAAVVLLLFGGPVLGEEVIRFKSGAELPIVTHQIDGDMIHVDLGDNAFMAFPMSLVESVEAAGKNVMIGRSTVGGTNVMKARPDPTGSFPVRASAPSMLSEKSRYESDDDKGRPNDPAIDVVGGVAVYRPVAGSGNPAKADTGVTGHRRVRESYGSPGALRGARQVGTKQVIGPAGPRTRGSASAPVITGIEFNPAPPPSPPPTPPPTSGDQNAGAGDQSGE